MRLIALLLLMIQSCSNSGTSSSGAPAVPSSSAFSLSVKEGGSVTINSSPINLSAIITGQADTPTFKWTASPDAGVGFTSADRSETSVSFSTEGTYEITVAVSTKDNVSASAKISVVYDATAPSISLSKKYACGYAGKELSFTIERTDGATGFGDLSLSMDDDLQGAACSLSGAPDGTVTLGCASAVSGHVIASVSDSASNSQLSVLSATFKAAVPAIGSADTCFGQGGSASLNPSTVVSGNDHYHGVISDGADGYYAFGYAETSAGTRDFLLSRFDSKGFLDLAFGTNGHLVRDISSGGSDEAFAAFLSAGRIVIAGKAGTGFGGVAFRTSGELDTSWGSSGLYSESGFAGASSSTLRKTLFDSSGNLFFAGSATVSGAERYAAKKITSRGLLDGAWGSSGDQSFQIAGDSSAFSAAVDSRGRLLLCGSSAVSLMGAARLTSAGVLDSTFDYDGKTTTAASGACSGIISQTDGSVSIFGVIGDSIIMDRLNPDGSPVSSFQTRTFSDAILSSPSILSVTQGFDQDDVVITTLSGSSGALVYVGPGGAAGTNRISGSGYLSIAEYPGSASVLSGAFGKRIFYAGQSTGVNGTDAFLKAVHSN